MISTLWLLAVAGLLGWAAVSLVRRLARPAAVASPLLFDHPAPPYPPAPSVLPIPPAPTLEHQIGRVISDGMDRVDAMRQFGADRFLTFMPMPDGACWSLTVVRHPSEESAKASYSRRPGVTH